MKCMKQFNMIFVLKNLLLKVNPKSIQGIYEKYYPNYYF